MERVNKKSNFQYILIKDEKKLEGLQIIVYLEGNITLTCKDLRLNLYGYTLHKVFSQSKPFKFML